MTPLLTLALTDDDSLADDLIAALGAQRAAIQQRRFPDGESYFRLVDDCQGRACLIVADLAYPDAKIPSLLFAADTLRELGAASIGLYVPYLPYMRQDKRFHPGEALTSRSFAAWISERFDWLVTVDPHLHRYPTLDALYTIPSRVVHAAPQLADWVAQTVTNPVLIGPDEESEQWVGDLAGRINAPFQVLTKQRLGDRNVVLSGEGLERWQGYTPVIVDDVISSGHTMIEAVRFLRKAGLNAPLCVSVHGIFADNAYQALLDAGASDIVTCHTVPHVSAKIDVVPLVAVAIGELVGRFNQAIPTP